MQIYTTDVLILGGGLSAYMAAYTMLKKRRKEKVMVVAPNRTGEAARALRGMALSRLDGDSAVKYGRPGHTENRGVSERPRAGESAERGEHGGV